MFSKSVNFLGIALTICQISGAFGIVTKARVYLVRAPTTVAQDGGTTDAGVLDFTQDGPGAPVHINGSITELKPKGKHGFHIHVYGDVENKCVSAGAHFNPENKTHGAPQNAMRHVGDLGNVEADENSIANVDLRDSVISLNGPNSIIGRAVVVHEKPDDMGLGNTPDSAKTGNAGARIVCGVIGITEESAKPMTNTAISTFDGSKFLVFLFAITLAYVSIVH